MEREKVRSIRKDLEVLLRDLGTKHNVNFSIGIMTITPGQEVRCKLTGRVVDPNAPKNVDPTRTRSFWEQECHYLDEDIKNAFGKILTDGCKVVGINPRATKNKVIVRKNNDEYVCSFKYVRNNLVKYKTTNM